MLDNELNKFDMLEYFRKIRYFLKFFTISLLLIKDILLLFKKSYILKLTVINSDIIFPIIIPNEIFLIPKNKEENEFDVDFKRFWSPIKE